MQMYTKFGKFCNRLLQVGKCVHHWLPWLWLGESGVWEQSLMFISNFVHREIIFLVGY